MTNEAKLMHELKSQLSVIRALLTEAADALDDTVRLLSSIPKDQQQTISSPTQGTLTPSSSSDADTLRSQLTFKGKRIPASGTDAGDIVARARAFAAERKSSTTECTESE